jgi:putative holliday junction resolvase
MSRILAIDFGERRIGLALSDPSRMIASPLTTLPRRAGKRPPWPEVERLIREHEVTELVFGLPLELDGEEGIWAAEVRGAAAKLAGRTGLPVHWVDERMSSIIAERAVRALGLRKEQREQKGRVDAAAAAVILQQYLALRSAEAHRQGEESDD